MTTSEPTTAEHEALVRLLLIARNDGGSQAERVAKFLLAWWNAEDCGGFDLTNLWGVDDTISADMVVIFGMIARVNRYPDALGYEELFQHVTKRWRPARA